LRLAARLAARLRNLADRGRIGLKACLAVWHNQAVLGVAEFRLKGEMSELQRLAADVERFCREQLLEEGAEFDLNLVLEELFVNAVEHGGCKGMDDAVRIRMETAAGEVRVTFEDRGVAFDPAGAPAPDLRAPLRERRPGGLGLHLVRTLAPDIRYERAGEWNRVTLVLR
jgi:anti-sigma regulatory factor (Ser/Thr protein kinase)